MQVLDAGVCDKCVEGDGRGLNASMSVCVNKGGGGLIATKIDSLVEHRKSNTKTDNITNRTVNQRG